MGYEWPDLVLPPLNLYNFPRQPMITFTSNSYGTTTTHTIHDGEDGTWGDLVNEFQNFLKARGYIFDMHFSFQEILEEAHQEALEKRVAPEEAVAKKAASF